MKTTKIIILTIIFSTFYLIAKTQYFVELDTIHKKYRFPKLIYPENLRVEEKVNTALQIDELLILPGKYKDNPYEVVTYRSVLGIQIDEKYEYKSWVDLSMHPNVLSVKLEGKKGGTRAFIVYRFFDKRTGDSFIFADLFSKEGLQELRKEIPSIKDNNRFVVEKNTIYIDKGKRIPKKYPLEQLRSYLSNYGLNLLFESDSIVRRNSLRGKLMEGKGEDYNKKPMNYLLYISQLDKEGNAKVYYWNKKIKDLNWYSDTKIKNGVLQADDYIYDSRSKEKVHAMYSLHIEKQKDSTWVGELQLGSPFYSLTFQEY